MDTGMIEQAAIDLFLPVMESATVLAAHYAQACGRDCIVAEDMRYGMMYAARNVAGRHVGSLYPEVYEDSEDEESEGEDEDSGTESDPEGEEEDEDEDSGTESEGDEEEEEDPEWTSYAPTEGVEPDELALKMNECARTWNEWIPSNPTEAALKSAVDSAGR
jgi:hypothetical protein